jgi:hypothetical protein
MYKETNKNHKDTVAQQKTADWLKENGICEKQFSIDNIWILQATKTANNLLKKHIDKLNEQEQTLLMNFCFVMMDSIQRHTITKRMSYAVMNINKKVRRTEFKAVKHVKKARQQIQSKRQIAHET